MRNLVVVIAAFCILTTVAASAQEVSAKELHLFGWAGDRAKAAKNFITLIDADPASPPYGLLLASAATEIVVITKSES